MKVSKQGNTEIIAVLNYRNYSINKRCFDALTQILLTFDLTGNGETETNEYVVQVEIEEWQLNRLFLNLATLGANR